MAPLPQRVRDEHRELMIRIELLRTLADSIGSTSAESIREDTGGEIAEGGVQPLRTLLG